jgi:hypothetical protein
LALAICTGSVVTGCNTQVRKDPMEQLHAALKHTDPDKIGRLPVASQAEQEALARFSDFASQMSVQRTPGMVKQVYATDVYFNDTLKEVRGTDDLEAYFEHSLGGAEDVTVEWLSRVGTTTCAGRCPSGSANWPMAD